jgi:hypothetical protein
MIMKKIFIVATLAALVGCVEAVPELQPSNGPTQVSIRTNVTNGNGPSQLLTQRKAWLHVATLKSDCSVDRYLGRGPLGSVPSLGVLPSKPYAFEIVINVKAGFETITKRSYERSVFVREGYSYVLDAQLEPNNDLVDLYEVAPNGAKRRVDGNYAC